MFHEQTHQVVWQEKYLVKNGIVERHVFLDDSLLVGDYLLAAFTGNSFFDDSSEIFSTRRIEVKKVISDNNIRTDVTKNLAVQDKRKHLQFGIFPEGGNLVLGTLSKLAFKAVNSDGMPIDFKGTLIEDTVSLVQFKSTHAGMGSLSFIPKSGKKYSIRLLEPAIDSTFLLPKIYSEGISLRLASRNEEFLEFIVSQGTTHVDKSVYLRGQIRGVVYCIAKGKLNNELLIRIPLKEFPYQGIAEFTLFNDSLVPIAERLVYLNPNKKLYIDTRLNKKRYKTREKVQLKIIVKDENGQPVIANLGLSVYDKLYQKTTDPKNIFTHCYLSSQLKGNIYNPSFYFDPKNKERESALDLLLQTQGWRRYL